MIIAAGLTPAWQQILQFEQLRVGEVNRARQAVWCGSGKVLNVGIALRHLGVEALTIAPLGGPAWAAIDREFAEMDVPRQWIPASEPTRVCTTLLDDALGATTELVENARPLATHELEEFCRAFAERAAQAEVVVLTGSLPPGTPPRIYSDLLGQTSAAAVLDIRGPELLAALECQPTVVKPNREELAATLGRPLADDRKLVAAMRELNDRGRNGWWSRPEKRPFGSRRAAKRGASTRPPYDRSSTQSDAEIAWLPALPPAWRRNRPSLRQFAKV